MLSTSIVSPGLMWRGNGPRSERHDGLILRGRVPSEGLGDESPPVQKMDEKTATVSQEGFEPTTKGLRVPCSTTELLAPHPILRPVDGAAERSSDCFLWSKESRTPCSPAQSFARSDPLRIGVRKTPG